MADFCNQCAREHGLPEGDFYQGKDAKPLPPGYAYAQICEGCGCAWTDNEGNCVAEHCLKEHGRVGDDAGQKPD